MNLASAPWYKGIYPLIHKILAVEGRVPPAGEIRLLTLGDFEAPPPSTVLGCAVRGVGVWFRAAPPGPVTFAHELIHLADKRKKEEKWEEFYAYNLAVFVVWLAEKRVLPPVSPLRLFEDVSEELLLQAISDVYRCKFSSLGEFFLHIGVIPPFLELGKDGWKVKKGYDKWMIAAEAVLELAAGAEYFEEHGKVLVRVLELIAQAK